MTELDGFRDEYDVNEYEYYFFDADEDGLPELGVRSDSGETYIFKYSPDEGEYSSWYSMESSGIYCWEAEKLYGRGVASI